MKVFKPTLLAAFTVLLFLSNHTISKAQFEQKFTFQAAGGYVQAMQPDFFSQAFHNGFSLDAGAQYNFSRSFGMVVLVKYSTFISHDEFLAPDANYNLIGISLCPKYRFLTHTSVNPYVYGGASLNYYRMTGGNIPMMDWEAQIGFTAGLGSDFVLTDNFALFLQGGIKGVNHTQEMLMSWYSQAGINISMFKARTL